MTVVYSNDVFAVDDYRQCPFDGGNSRRDPSRCQCHCRRNVAAVNVDLANGQRWAHHFLHWILAVPALVVFDAMHSVGRPPNSVVGRHEVSRENEAGRMDRRRHDWHIHGWEWAKGVAPC